MFLLSIFRSKNRFAFLICWIFGFAVSLVSRPAVWGPFVGMLLTYHLFLAWLVYSAEKGADRTYGIPVTVAGHLGFVVLVMAAKLALIASLVAYLHSQPKEDLAVTAYYAARILQIVQITMVYGLCVLERNSLFSRQGKLASHPWLPPAAAATGDAQAAQFQAPQFQAPPTYQFIVPPVTEAALPAPSIPAPVAASYQEDEHSAWLNYLATRKISEMKRGMTVSEEFEQWRKARERNRAKLSSMDAAIRG